MESAKIEKLKCDILGDFQTLCTHTKKVIHNVIFCFFLIHLIIRSSNEKKNFVFVTFGTIV